MHDMGRQVKTGSSGVSPALLASRHLLGDPSYGHDCQVI